VAASQSCKRCLSNQNYRERRACHTGQEKCGRVLQIKCLCAKLRIQGFPNPKVAEDAEVQVRCAWSSSRTACHVAEPVPGCVKTPSGTLKVANNWFAAATTAMRISVGYPLSGTGHKHVWQVHCKYDFCFRRFQLSSGFVVPAFCCIALLPPDPLSRFFDHV
jgi:hypothetical protein